MNRCLGRRIRSCSVPRCCTNARFGRTARCKSIRIALSLKDFGRWKHSLTSVATSIRMLLVTAAVKVGGLGNFDAKQGFLKADTDGDKLH